jgi:hypothetical protein
MITIGFRIGILALLVSACGGNVVADGAGGSTSASTSDATSSSSVSVTSSSTGPGDCASGCGPAEVCYFPTGECIFGCDAGGLDPCGPGFACSYCATTSCAQCSDCVDACLPSPPGTCDDHDDCLPTEVCIYGAGLCKEACDGNDPGCSSPDLVCNFCATSSCPGCDDCVGACTTSF